MSRDHLPDGVSPPEENDEKNDRPADLAPAAVGHLSTTPAHAVIRISAPGCELTVTTTVPLPVENVALA